MRGGGGTAPPGDIGRIVGENPGFPFRIPNPREKQKFGPTALCKDAHEKKKKKKIVRWGAQKTQKTAQLPP